ncbi:MAG: LPS export ABC transporter permease LptF [Steroidobacteraceae bacterium]|nr:LPS export ABC transporter permease LptF [Steroidobacteraceae bacterium]
MATLDRYVLREVALSWLAVTGVLLLILVANQLAAVLGQAAERGYPRSVIVGLIGFTSLQNLTVLIPVGLLLGIVLALGRLYHESEMAAIRACGVGLSRLLRPVGVLAAVVTGLLAWLALDASPRAYAEAQEIRREALRQAQFGVLEPGRFHSFAGGDAVFYAESRDPDGTFRNVFVQRRAQDRVELVLAARARHVVEEGGALHVLVLYDGERYEGLPGQPQLRRIFFEEHGLPVRVTDPESGPLRIEARPTTELLRAADAASHAELQWRLSLPLMALVLTLLAVPLAELQPRQGRYGRIGLAILVYFVYANLLSAAKTWVEKGTLDPALGLWWTHLVVLAGAAWLWFRQSPPAWATR